MIPILYDKTETAFTSNGLGRLRDIIECQVVEERNSIYECDFKYPVSGANFDLIQLGRIVAVTHDDTGDIQPFDIVSYEKPIDGVVSFHCVHVSYRQSYMTMGKTSGWGNKPNGGSTVGWQLPINSLEDALTMITASSPPTNPFSYFTDKTSSGYLACADGTPRTVRQILGGIEGSILDTYGGEYLFDKWTVSLLSSRGQYRDFTIRYGVNMLDYKDETDSEGTYSNCIPYWTDGTEFVVGDMQSKGTTITGRGECVPLDVSDKFEDKPTKAAVESMGLNAIKGNNPVQSITVSFVRLQDTEEYAGFQNLLTCRLCDTIKVIFPEYNTQGDFKIVKTVWNVLTGKYDEMELGQLSTTLSEALGITNNLIKAAERQEGTTLYRAEIQYKVPALSAGARGYWSISHSELPTGTHIISMMPWTGDIAASHGLQLTPVNITTSTLFVNYYAPQAVTANTVTLIFYITYYMVG